MNHALSRPGFFSTCVAQLFEGRAHFFDEQFWSLPKTAKRPPLAASWN
jgi:hypothetical protein